MAAGGIKPLRIRAGNSVEAYHAVNSGYERLTRKRKTCTGNIINHFFSPGQAIPKDRPCSNFSVLDKVPGVFY